MSDVTRYYGTGIAPPGSFSERPATQKDLVEAWWVQPLVRMGGDDAFACLTLCFPLIEAIIRLELPVPDDRDVVFSDNSPALHWFADFMRIPEAQARAVWDGLRNGLLHRAMLKGDLNYELNGDRPGRPADFRDNTVFIYVWELRDKVVDRVRRHNRKLWKDTSTPLPRVYLRT